jgi:hypothetical protein
MLFKEIIAVYCENHTEHTNTLCGQNADIFNAKGGEAHSYSLALNIKFTYCSGSVESSGTYYDS